MLCPSAQAPPPCFFMQILNESFHLPRIKYRYQFFFVYRYGISFFSFIGMVSVFFCLSVWYQFFFVYRYGISFFLFIGIVSVFFCLSVLYRLFLLSVTYQSRLSIDIRYLTLLPCCFVRLRIRYRRKETRFYTYLESSMDCCTRSKDL